ncbi:O-acetyl-ADP-ribose deacetylase (regulator of RNase III), contains Macro domain [Mucilaginibacter gossypiicola]|uniref:O-acetyl-ADP-ribose deacetylase (Regulator of RNase III), contains Macro domain n=1 Tax=Mucilaginibacter gossypiicola TaxID=551995 RepID=A0A1H8LSJ9_9SPHI|nr:macro domain-containing protein [Mucilaginibacter gossypiicola]SEO08074.1 O-acetyl-ADP-ribose deacetylase (regulator of RNase III), contains Macro domain [Mucilaginibacter gossypiicola]
MIMYLKGNLLEDEAEALVNTVNCVGVMGKGIALAFRHAFPDNYLLYRAACVAGELQVGKLWVVSDFNLICGQKVIINLPTKKHWRNPSQYGWVEAGLQALAGYLQSNPVGSLAMPAPGCGNGGLAWSKVKPLVERYLSGLDMEIRVYEPE